jgi:histidine kinase-like protein
MLRMRPATRAGRGCSATTRLPGREDEIVRAGNQALPVHNRTLPATPDDPSPDAADLPASPASPGEDDGEPVAGFAWRLPGDPSCARRARAHVRQTLARLLLPGSLTADAELAVSELAANAWEHALPTRPAPGSAGAPAALPELWLYRRGEPPHAEIVCGVFDTRRDAWPQPRQNPPEPSPEGATLDGVILDAVLAGEPGKGRGLVIVRAVSHATGCHRTRSRLNVPAIPGKVVWFTTRIPAGSPAARPSAPDLTADQAAHVLTGLLAARGVPAATRHDSVSTVVSTTTGLTVRCGNGTFQWSAGGAGQRAFTDIADATENIVRLHEDRDCAPSPR